VKHKLRERSPIFSFITTYDEWIFLSPKTTFRPRWTSSLLTQLTHIWCSKHWWQHMQWWCLLKKTHNYMLSEHHAITSFPLLLRCMDVFFCFDLFFITCAHITIACHQRSFLIPLMLVSYYEQHMSITLQNAQAIVIFQCAWLRFLISFTHHS
jgi:hypothetical protein